MSAVPEEHGATTALVHASEESTALSAQSNKGSDTGSWNISGERVESVSITIVQGPTSDADNDPEVSTAVTVSVMQDEDLDDDFIPRGGPNSQTASVPKKTTQPQKNTGNEPGGGRKGDQGKSEANGVKKGTPAAGKN